VQKAAAWSVFRKRPAILSWILHMRSDRSAWLFVAGTAVLSNRSRIWSAWSRKRVARFQASRSRRVQRSRFFFGGGGPAGRSVNAVVTLAW